MKNNNESKIETEVRLQHFPFFKNETSESRMSKLMIHDVIMNTAVGTTIDIRDYFDETIFRGIVADYLKQGFSNTEVTQLRIESGNLIIGI